MKKFTVEHDEEFDRYEVVEWSDPECETRTGKVAAKFPWKCEADGEAEILNVGYEYEMSEITTCEWDL